MNLKFSRSLDIINPDKLNMPIVIVGAGAIGSWATLALAKMGCSDLTVIDYDKVDEENIGPQLYGMGDIGKYKVSALKKHIKELVGMDIKIYPSKGESVLGVLTKVILVLALDSLEARRQCVIANEGNPPSIIIDMRMKKDLISAYLAFDKKSTLNFHKSLSKKVKIDKGKCSEKAVSYNTFICGGLVANFVKKFANREDLPHSLIVDLEILNIN